MVSQKVKYSRLENEWMAMGKIENRVASDCGKSERVIFGAFQKPVNDLSLSSSVKTTFRKLTASFEDILKNSVEE